jgi:parallel beta-helix repeat protein
VRDLALIKNGQGLLLYGVSNSIIENVSISHNYDGIRAIESSNNTIEGCAITNNKHIRLDGHNNTVNGNTISNHGEVQLGQNEAKGGWIVEVPYDAIAVSGDNNTIFHNNFINNLGSPRISGDNNNWDNGYPSGGNYWNDYNGQDSDEDGIGDTPYIIDSNCQDRYPQMKPSVYHEYDLAVSLNTSHYYPTYGTSSILEATVYNLGLNNETDAKLDLIVENDVVDSIVIPQLPSGSTYNHVLNYTWSPTVGDRYCNFTVFVDPAPGEKVTVNNVATTSVLVCHRHDVAVVNVVPQEKWIIVEFRQIVNLEATIKNIGTVTENVTVLLEVAGKSGWIELETRSIVSNLVPTAETIVAFNLNTTEMIRGINKTCLLSAGLPDRIFPFDEYVDDLKNNHYLFKIMITPLDLNGDRKVNMVDIAVAAKAFGTEPGNERWNPIADVNEDGVVNTSDISVVVEDFGKSY